MKKSEDGFAQDTNVIWPTADEGLQAEYMYKAVVIRASEGGLGLRNGMLAWPFGSPRCREDYGSTIITIVIRTIIL